jgi:hypothetical protein
VQFDFISFNLLLKQVIIPYMIIFCLSVLTERLKDGGTILCAEGYMWEVERRGFLALGNFLPEVVLERPSVIRSVHEEFVFSGSDVVEAFTVCIFSVSLFSFIIMIDSDFHELIIKINIKLILQAYAISIQNTIK